MHASTGDADYSWVKEFYIPELVTFPGAAHDDQVDATSQALIWIMANSPNEGAYMKVLG
jgi:phage terminase large subunit-like protein